MKKKVENELGYKISNSNYKKAYEYAVNKQYYIYRKEKRAVVFQDWYLINLIVEYVRSIELTGFTLSRCKFLNDKEKEHLTSCQSALSGE